MNKELVYNNINEMLNTVFIDKYIELTSNISLEDTKKLEDVAANIFNAILVGCQLFDDKDYIIDFVNDFSFSLNSSFITRYLEHKNIPLEYACDRLNHGFGVHFTTPNICNEIIKKGKLAGYGTNAIFTKEEDELINLASKIQRQNDPTTLDTMKYLFKGWGTGVSSFGSTTTGFWMYHTPESLSFLFGNISLRDKDKAMSHVASCISSLDDELKKKVFTMMSNLYDRLIGTDQVVGCILIDRDALTYEVDYYYHTGTPEAVERRPFNHGLSGLDLNDNKINDDIDISNLKFLKIPTVLELERIKQERISNTL